MDQETKKYHLFEEIPEEIISQLVFLASQSPYRQNFHIESKSGYLNDPNGFSFYNGQYHLFYQWSPIAYAKDNIWYQGWHHLVSDDLVRWRSLGPGIQTETKYDTHGAYSGSAINLGEELLIFYTGNTRDEKWHRIPYQVIAKMNKDNHITKVLPPVICDSPAGYTDHFRDPKLWRTDEGFYAIIGIQRENLTGCAMIAFSKNGVDWKFLGEVRTKLNSFGYMWECPDYFELDDKGIMIFSPQGLEEKDGKYQNIYQTGYIVGDKIHSQQLSLGAHTDFKELDLGFDFYAPQSSVMPDGRRILIGWMGLPELSYPTESYAYCGCLTVPRELSLLNDEIIQLPITELSNYRKDEKKICAHNDFVCSVDTSIDLECTISQANQNDWEIAIASEHNGEDSIKLVYSHQRRLLFLDRSGLKQPLAIQYGRTRNILREVPTTLSLRILLDQSSLEIFLNGGRQVASSRIFFTSSQRYFQFKGEKQALNGKLWRLAIKECVYD